MCRATVQRCARGLYRAVPVGVGLDDREETCAFGQVVDDARHVGANRLEVNVRPAQLVGQSLEASLAENVHDQRDLAEQVAGEEP